MKLKTYITLLESLPIDKIIRNGLKNPHSWRENYPELAFEPAHNVSIKDMLNEAKDCVDKTFTGWKGGDFKMSGDTRIHVATIGDCTAWGIPDFNEYDSHTLCELISLAYILEMFE
jgi:hypothetical protein